jgi:hypothetical protein
VENGRVLVNYCAGEKGNISEPIASISQRTLRRVAQNMVKRVNACIQEKGGHYEVKLLLRFKMNALYIAFIHTSFLLSFNVPFSQTSKYIFRILGAS